MINIKVYSGDDVQVYSFEKDTPKEDIKAALIADKNESSTLNIEEEVRSSMGTDLESRVKDEMRGNVENPVAGLLNWIGQHEASGHGYNQVSGFHNSMPITEMTIGELQAKQRAGEIKRLPGAASNAAGRYQFMPNTLDTAMNLTKLPKDTVMTPEIQDRLAVALMENRGLSDFIRGEMSLEDFANEMAKEWAFLPVVSGDKAGESHYNKIAGNKALVSIDEALSAFNNIKEGGALFVEEGRDISRVVPEYFAGLTTDEPNPSRPESPDRSVKRPREEIVTPGNLQDYEESTVQKGPQSSQERAGDSFANIAVPQPTSTRKAPERFRTSSIAEEATALQAASAKAPAVPMPVNPMEGMTDDMNPLLKGVPYEPGSMGRV